MSDARAGFTVAIGAASFWAAWFASSALPIPLVWYLPLEHRFEFGAAPAGIAVCFFGQLLFAAPVAAVVAAAVTPLIRRFAIGRAQVWLATAWCALLLCFVAGYFAFTLWGRALPG